MVTTKSLDVHRLLDELRADALTTGIPARADLASSDSLEHVSSRETEVREDLVRLLGPALSDRRRNEIVAASWESEGTKIRLALEHEDKEAPLVLSLEASYSGRPQADGPPPPCNCAGLKAFKNPFLLRAPVFLLASIRKTHVRVAETTFHGESTGLLQCRACGRFRQTAGDWQCAFDVPPIEPDAWTSEPYAFPGAHEDYERRAAKYLISADRTTRDEPCRVEGCAAMAVRFSVFCFDHHRDGRPTLPPGRPLPLAPGPAGPRWPAH